MKSYEQPIALVKKHKQRKLNIDPDNPAKDNIYNKVFHGISNKELSSEAGLAKNYFNCTPAEPKYKMFKSRFKNELGLMALNFDFDEKKLTTQYKEKLKCYQKYIFLQILLLNGYNEEADSIARSLSRKAKDYNLLFIEAECYYALAHFARHSTNLKAFNSFVKKHDKVLKHYQILSKAGHIRYDIELSIYNSTKTKLNKNTILEKIKSLKKCTEESDNPEIRYFYYKSLIEFYRAFKNYNKCIEISEKILKFISKHKFLQGFSKIGDLEREKMISYFNLNDFDNAEISLKNCLNLIPKKNKNELVLLNDYIHISMYQNNINKTLKIYERLTESPFYKYEDNHNNIYLNLRIGYISFICKQRNINLDKNPNYLNIKNFDIDDFYKKATLLKSDKKGLHISLLILQILFYLLENRFDKLSKRLDNLTKYKSRYLDKKEFPRFQLFFKMISLIDKQYNPYDLNSIKNIKKEAQNLLKQMKSHQKKFDQKLESYEIMPYEHLWEEVMNILDEHAKVKV